MSSSYLGDNCFLNGRRVLNRGVGELNSNHLNSIRMGFGNSWTKTLKIMSYVSLPKSLNFSHFR